MAPTFMARPIVDTLHGLRLVARSGELVEVPVDYIKIYTALHNIFKNAKAQRPAQDKELDSYVKHTLLPHLRDPAVGEIFARHSENFVYGVAKNLVRLGVFQSGTKAAAKFLELEGKLSGPVSSGTKAQLTIKAQSTMKVQSTTQTQLATKAQAPPEARPTLLAAGARLEVKSQPVAKTQSALNVRAPLDLQDSILTKVQLLLELQGLVLKTTKELSEEIRKAVGEKHAATGDSSSQLSEQIQPILSYLGQNPLGHSTNISTGRMATMAEFYDLKSSINSIIKKLEVKTVVDKQIGVNTGKGTRYGRAARDTTDSSSSGSASEDDQDKETAGEKDREADAWMKQWL